jgi:hypothetical protein
VPPVWQAPWKSSASSAGATTAWVAWSARDCADDIATVAAPKAWNESDLLGPLSPQATNEVTASSPTRSFTGPLSGRSGHHHHVAKQPERALAGWGRGGVAEPSVAGATLAFTSLRDLASRRSPP